MEGLKIEQSIQCVITLKKTFSHRAIFIHNFIRIPSFEFKSKIVMADFWELTATEEKTV